MRRTFGPRPNSVARALDVQSRASLLIVAGSLSAPPEPTRSVETPKVSFFIFLPLLLFMKYHSSPHRLGSHGTTVGLPYFPFVTATNGASVRVSESVRVCHCRVLQQCERGTVSRREVQFQGGGGSLLLAVCCCVSYLYHSVSFFTLWQPWYNSGRTLRCYFMDG